MTAFAVPANTAFTNYSELVSTINDWMDREDLDGVAPQLIALAEDEMIARLSPLFQEKSVDVMAVNGLAPLPTDYGILNRVIHDECTLPQYSAAAAVDVPKGSSAVGYTLEADKLRLWPSGDHLVTLLYNPRLPRLSAGNPNNTLMDQFPSLYFYGAMVFANGYVVNDGRAATFRSLFDNMMQTAIRYYQRQRFAGPLVPRVSFVP